MGKSKELLIVRYISILILLLQFFVVIGHSSIFSIVFILLLIVNNHLRIFYFEKDINLITSIILEMLVVMIVQLKLGGAIILYLTGISIDVFSLKNNKVKFILTIIVFMIGISSSFISNINESFSNLILLGTLLILLNYISTLYKTKLEAQKLYDKLRVSEENLIKANNELEGYINSIEELTLLKERNRISREIHDSVGHALTTAMIQLSAMEAIANKENSSLKGMANNLREFINESFQDVKKAVRELKSDEYENFQGILRLQDVCSNFEKMSGIQVKTIISKGEWSLTSKQINHLYRITQEVLSNSLRHGKATKVNVIMNFTNDEFVISFSDNGIGTDNIVESGVGLKSIKERASEINGIAYIKSSLNNGFFIKVIVPIEVEI